MEVQASKGRNLFGDSYVVPASIGLTQKDTLNPQTARFMRQNVMN
jgi:hypothetical protein